MLFDWFSKLPRPATLKLRDLFSLSTIQTLRGKSALYSTIRSSVYANQRSKNALNEGYSATQQLATPQEAASSTK